ncbi:hypothetical protein [Nocardia brasiliensis]|uniref:hypothetical protein n=1 Tax=Nocardia brasiliensis TaxID=37326 RepID=UPI0024581CFF|nr:hypothetical protein [Nocardia brasiliensis]
MTIPGWALLLIALAFAVVLWRKALVPWMRDSGRAVAAVGFEQFDAVFVAGKQHEFEQVRSTRWTDAAAISWAAVPGRAPWPGGWR